MIRKNGIRKLQTNLRTLHCSGFGGFFFALLSAPFPVVIDALSGGCSAGLAFLAMVR
jgi:hypothetical protein